MTGAHQATMPVQREAPDSFHAQALAAIGNSDLKGAERTLREWSEAEPGSGDAHKLRGLVLAAMHRYRDAIPSLDRAMEHFPGDEMLLLSKAESLSMLRKPKGVLECAEQVLRMSPARAEAHVFRGLALLAMGKLRQAIQSFDEAVTISPDLVQAHFNKGVALTHLRLAERVGESVRHEAIASLERVMQLSPDLAGPYYGRALMRRDLGDLDGAIRDCERALELQPDRRKVRAVRWLYAFCLIYSGDWERGWKEWECHLDLNKRRGKNRRFGVSIPSWTGQSLEGKTIAVLEEGGFGDTIQLVRFLPQLSARGARVVMHLRAAVKPLVFPPGETSRCTPAEPTYDYQCTLLSLPSLLDVRPDTMPGTQGYICAERAKVVAWREKLGPPRRLRVGIAWSGNPKQKEDMERSLHFSDVRALFDVDAEFICLQKVLKRNDRKDFRAQGTVSFHGDELSDFTDTAALCENVDVVVSTCTSVAHLAGAMGKPVWIMLARNADWRWMDKGDSSPWYASARLFRQERLGEWSPVVRRVRDELERLARTRAASLAAQAA